MCESNSERIPFVLFVSFVVKKTILAKPNKGRGPALRAPSCITCCAI